MLAELVHALSDLLRFPRVPSGEYKVWYEVLAAEQPPLQDRGPVVERDPARCR
jgi:hypothetical protein